jgi:hypothetical protein
VLDSQGREAPLTEDGDASADKGEKSTSGKGRKTTDGKSPEKA